MEQALTLPLGSEGLSFLPYLTGERTPHLDPHIRGGWFGLSLHHTTAHLARAAFEGVAFAVRDGLTTLPTSSQVETLFLVGGGSLQPAWCQLLADVLDKALAASPVSTASARGAALLAGIADGTLSYEGARELAPTPSIIAEPRRQPRLEEAYQRYRSLYPIASPLKAVE